MDIFTVYSSVMFSRYISCHHNQDTDRPFTLQSSCPPPITLGNHWSASHRCHFVLLRTSDQEDPQQLIFETAFSSGPLLIETDTVWVNCRISLFTPFVQAWESLNSYLKENLVRKLVTGTEGQLWDLYFHPRHWHLVEPWELLAAVRFSYISTGIGCVSGGSWLEFQMPAGD